MPAESSTPDADRVTPHAAREMASMFDAVSRRYDLLNALMTLGQDSAWRREMWRAVPEEARRVLDLCTGSGVSLSGLRRPGRLVLGMDVSLRMLERAAATQEAGGWAPRLACADAFALPLRDGTLDAITLAFGVRNLRPRREALAELARALAPGGTLAVLEAAAPGPGPFAPLHRFHLRRVVPLLGRLSSDPSAYQYLSRSIFEFGAGPEFERDLEATGFERVESRSFLLGATRLWVARRAGSLGQNPAAPGEELQNARPATRESGKLPHRAQALEAEWRWWLAAQAVLSAALAVALGYGLVAFSKWGRDFALLPWQRRLTWLLLGLGLITFLVRTVLLAFRLQGSSRPR